MYINKTYYTKNGRQKNKSKWEGKVNEAKELGGDKVDYQVEGEKGVKVTNIYMQSISSALILDLYYEGVCNEERLSAE
jgi:hypothetical protein